MYVINIIMYNNNSSCMLVIVTSRVQLAKGCMAFIALKHFSGQTSVSCRELEVSSYFSKVRN